MVRRGFIVGALVWGCSGSALAAKDRLFELRQVLAGLSQGGLSATQAANKISLLGMEAAATDAVAFELRRSTDGRTRAVYLELLGQIATPHPEALALCSQVASSGDDLGQRLSALRALGRMKQPSSAAVLAPLLADKLLGVRRETTRALVAVGKAASAAPLLAAARVEDDAETRALMLVGVGRLQDQRQVKGLEALLTSSSELTRLSAARALCLLGARRGLAAAKGLLASSDGLERLQGVMLFEGAPAAIAAPLLTPMTADADPAVKARAARLLAQAGDSAWAGFLVVESFKAPMDVRGVWETELELLRLSDEKRAAFLKAAGLK